MVIKMKKVKKKLKNILKFKKENLAGKYAQI